MCLAEKGLDWESRHVDIFAFENYEPAYTRLNPKAVVPTLDHDGNVLIESNIILEYLEDVFPKQVPLRPEDPFHAMVSLELDLHVLERPQEEWLCCDSRARWMGDGFLLTETDIWSADRLCATSSQMMLVRVMAEAAT